tara:strand:- start:908 stop:2071 length:1164 start_codon:yes stop_codon:yes gene_type:complete
MSKKLLVKISNLVLLLIGCSLPLSIALSNIFVVLLAVLILLQGNVLEKIQKIKSSKWMLSVTGLWVLYIIYWGLFGCFQEDTFWIIKKTSLLLLLPTFYIANFSNKTIRNSVFAFLFFMFVSSVIGILENYGAINLNLKWEEVLFLEYPEHNVFLAFSLIIVLYSLFRINLPIKYTIVLLVFFLFYLISIFTEAGRSGQLAFLLSMVLFFIFLFKSHWKLILISLISIFVFVLVVYNTSESVKKRYNYERVIKKIIDGESDRGVLLMGAITLIKEDPVFGYGTGSFMHHFQLLDKGAKLVAKRHKHPHNNYLYVWIELGALGLILLVSIFYFQIKELLKKEDGIYRILFPIIFLIIMTADNYFYNQNTLVLYLFLSIITINYQYKLS